MKPTEKRLPYPVIGTAAGCAALFGALTTASWADGGNCEMDYHLCDMEAAGTYTSCVAGCPPEGDSPEQQAARNACLDSCDGDYSFAMSDCEDDLSCCRNGGPGCC